MKRSGADLTVLISGSILPRIDCIYMEVISMYFDINTQTWINIFDMLPLPIEFTVSIFCPQAMGVLSSFKHS